MGLLKTEFTRFFTFGFAAGALLVVVMAGGEIATNLAHDMSPVAEAQAAQ